MAFDSVTRNPVACGERYGRNIRGVNRFFGQGAVALVLSGDVPFVTVFWPNDGA